MISVCHVISQDHVIRNPNVAYHLAKFGNHRHSDS